MPPVVTGQMDRIAELCARYGVRRLDLFGSATDGRFDPETSDFDFLVDFADRSPGYAARYMDLADGLEALLGRPVDLVTEASVVSSDVRQRIERQRRVVYGPGSRSSAA